MIACGSKWPCKLTFSCFPYWLVQLYRQPHQFTADLLLGACEVRYEPNFRECVLIPWGAGVSSSFKHVLERSEAVSPGPAAFWAAQTAGDRVMPGRLPTGLEGGRKEGRGLGERSRSTTRSSVRKRRSKSRSRGYSCGYRSRGRSRSTVRGRRSRSRSTGQVRRGREGRSGRARSMSACSTSRSRSPSSSTTSSDTSSSSSGSGGSSTTTSTSSSGGRARGREGARGHSCKSRARSSSMQGPTSRSLVDSSMQPSSSQRLRNGFSTDQPFSPTILKVPVFSMGPAAAPTPAAATAAFGGGSGGAPAAPQGLASAASSKKVLPGHLQLELLELITLRLTGPGGAKATPVETLAPALSKPLQHAKVSK